MKYSIIIPAFNAEKSIQKLLDSIFRNKFESYEVIVVDDCSTDRTAEIVKPYPCKLIQLIQNRGPAYCRNVGAKNAEGDILVFTDSDCKVEQDWLQSIEISFKNNTTDAIMGKLKLLSSNYLGNAISALGFPAGGDIGFDRIWRVDPKGYTTSLSTCNCAIKTDAFWNAGGFDESFPYAGGEDSFLAYNLTEKGYQIMYCPDTIVYHEARDSFHGFIMWQFKRGVSSFIFSQKISKKKGGFLSLRLWSTKNVIKCYIWKPKILLIIPLLITGYVTQIFGYSSAYYNRKSL